MTYTSDDVVLANIRRNNRRNGVNFNMYVQSGGNGVLSQQALLQAVEVSSITSQLIALSRNLILTSGRSVIGMM